MFNNTFKLILTTFIVLHSASKLSAQCDTTYWVNDVVIENSDFLSGVHIIDGDFVIPSGTTVYVLAYSSNSCGKLEIHAQNIIIQGTINGDYSGYSGGNFGTGGATVNSITGDSNALTSCSNKDNAGRVEVSGGTAGSGGLGIGGGLTGQNGSSGSGPKQKCESSADTYGLIPGAGGAGAGGGGSYGGAGTSGTTGGNGSANYSSTGTSVSPQYTILNGQGGMGGSFGTVYGTSTGTDIDLGSGGAGAGGGGRSYESGLDGLRGGNGGGLVILKATDDLQIEGDISVNGEDGKVGGHAGNGGATSKCCSDLCDDCGEATFSTGAGGGGGSGAGSGGGILLQASTASITGSLSALGGNGGNGGNSGAGISCSYSATFCGSQSVSTEQGQTGGNGGAGGGGRIKIFVDVCTSTQMNPTVTIEGGENAQNGTYSIICNGYLDIEEKENSKFSIYPNPAKDQITLELIGNNDEETRFELVNLNGVVVYSEKVYGQTLTATISHLSPGLYIATIYSNNQKATLKVIKQ